MRSNGHEGTGARQTMKDDVHWRRSRLAARIILRGRAGKLTPRDRRVGALLKRDPGVTDRLIDQALASLRARPARRRPAHRDTNV